MCIKVGEGIIAKVKYPCVAPRKLENPHVLPTAFSLYNGRAPCILCLVMRSGVFKVSDKEKDDALSGAVFHSRTCAT